jgi:hypothetical protein
MVPLASDLRNKLEHVVIEARDAAENGARDALEALAVHNHEPFAHMTPELRKLRSQLRARARQLGDRQDTAGRMTINQIVTECAYEHWNRMLFARFLAENGLLIEPHENMSISLAEAEELAKEDGIDVWIFASRCAQRMLPQIFRPDDPLLQVSFAMEHLLKLENLLDSLPSAVLTASDALGWVYQFWQSKKKDQVNRSEVKIGADEIAAVTQLFTEPYMVKFLLHNTLGAWWAGKQLSAENIASEKTEDELRQKLSLPSVGWEYLRFVRVVNGESESWWPAAGTFEGWPKTAAELKVLDPCCGSGHFLVAALQHLVPIRMAEERLSATEAVDAVLRDNIHGLEIDERCCQITAFALALAAWIYPGTGGYRKLPVLNIAHTGIAAGGTRDQWMRILEGHGNLELRFFFGQLYDLFRKAPTLGSLINPHRFLGSGMLNRKGMETLLQHLKTAISEDPNAGPEKHEMGVAAQGLAKAAELLADRYTLVVTNVPYLGRGKQDDILREHLETQYPMGKADLATAFVLRCLEFCGTDGSIALVTPQNWLFLTTYANLRKALLYHREWNIVARLGEHAFDSSAAAGAFAAMLVLSARASADIHLMAGLDVSSPRGQLPIYAEEKAAMLRGEQPAEIAYIIQSDQIKNPDAVVTFSRASSIGLLREYAACNQGMITGDNPQYTCAFWELPSLQDGLWTYLQRAPESNTLVSGCNNLVRWEEGNGRLAVSAQARICGQPAWGKHGVVVAVTSNLYRSLYLGSIFDCTAAALTPRTNTNITALMACVYSNEFPEVVRKYDPALSVTESSFLKIPFDLDYWQKVATEKFPNGLPEPESDDPTQWLFHGRPKESTAPIQVAVARLLGYRWPAELDDKMRLSKRALALVKRCEELAKFVDNDGIIPIQSVRGEEPAAERVQALLSAAGIDPGKGRELAGGADLEDWLCNSFFEEHCKMFHNRPYIWHIWDGRKRDGFGVLVNYHKLCEGNGKGRKLLESLTYAYLGEWITRQKDGVKRGEGGAEDRLAAAMELQKILQAILDGEPPFDIFVRWKPLPEQPVGWEPDINDGVRVNIRPFLASDLSNGKKGAGILRSKPNIKWTKDRGKEPKRPIREFPWFWGWDGSENYAGGPLSEFTGERFNECHYSNDFKHQARQQAKSKE